MAERVRGARGRPALQRPHPKEPCRPCLPGHRRPRVQSPAAGQRQELHVEPVTARSGRPVAREARRQRAWFAARAVAALASRMRWRQRQRMSQQQPSISWSRQPPQRATCSPMVTGCSRAGEHSSLARCGSGLQGDPYRYARNSISSTQSGSVENSWRRGAENQGVFTSLPALLHRGVGRASGNVSRPVMQRTMSRLAGNREQGVQLVSREVGAASSSASE
jgi:hypothetical protein